MESNFKDRKRSPELNIPTQRTNADLEQGLADIIMRCKRKPTVMPDSAFEAANWFMRLIEPQRHYEKQVDRKTKDGKTYYIWGYADRVKSTLLIFLDIEKKLQELIVAAKQDGIYWRGDDFDFFIKVIDEHEKMKTMGSEKYRKAAIAEMKSSMMRMVSS